MTTEKCAWFAYSWEPSTKVPGGRKRRKEITVNATNRMEAKQLFLDQFPDETSFSVAASRVKVATEAETSTDAAGETAASDETASSDSSSEDPDVAPKAIHKSADAAKLNKHVLWPQVEEMISVAENASETFKNRTNALSWLSGVARIDPASTLSVFCADKVTTLRAQMASQTQDSVSSENDEQDVSF